MKWKSRLSAIMTRTTAVLLCAVMLVLFCAGCSRRGGRRGEEDFADNRETTPATESNETAELAEEPEAGSVTPAASVTEVNPDDVIDPDNIVDTYNVVLVLDTSGSMEKSDQYGLALQQAPKMFLESMYAGNASQDRMKGAKKANLNIITYNDTVRPIYSQLYSLDDPGTVDGLNDALSKINEQDTFGTHDTALGDALEQAVQMLPTSIRRPGGPPPGAPGGPGGVSAGGPGFGGPPPGPGPFGGQEQNLIILFTDGYSVGGASAASYGRSSTDAYTGQTPVRRVSSDLNTPDSPQTAFPEPVMPYFGGKTQEPLERALIAAKQRQCEIIVLGLNTTGELDNYWEEFKKIANYTQLNMGPPPPPPGANPQGGPFPGGGGPGWMGGAPDGGPMLPGGFMPPPPNVRGVGGGMFESTDSDFPYVNYMQARTLVDAQHFYIQAASAMLQGTGATSPSAKMEGDMNRYDCEVQKNGISAVVFYVLSSDTEGVFVDDLIDPEGNSWQRALRNYEDESNGWDSSGAMRKRWYSGCGVITFLNPAPGIWQLKAHTASGDRSQFSVYMAQIGGIDLEISFKQNERFADDGTIYVRAKYQGSYMSADFYKDVTAMCDVMPAIGMPPPPMMGDQTGGASQTGAQSDPMMPPGPPPGGGPIQLTYDPDSNAMTADYRASFPGNYMVNARLTASQVEYTSSGTISFTPRPSEDIVVRKVGKSVKLVPELTDTWKSIPLTIVDWTINPRGLISVERDKRNDQSLTIEGLENGSGTLEIIVTGTVENLPTQPQWTISYPVTVGR